MTVRATGMFDRPIDAETGCPLMRHNPRTPETEQPDKPSNRDADGSSETMQVCGRASVKQRQSSSNTAAQKGCSPRRRGCSLGAGQRAREAVVFPAQAGVFRSPSSGLVKPVRVPRAGGGVPRRHGCRLDDGACSPRRRGCSVVVRELRLVVPVVSPRRRGFPAEYRRRAGPFSRTFGA